MMMRHSIGKIPLFVMNPGNLMSDVCEVNVWSCSVLLEELSQRE